MRFNKLLWLLTVLIISGCSKNDTSSNLGGSNTNNSSSPVLNTSHPNILLIISDDMGLDATPGYSIGSSKPNMPHLQALMNSGVRFNNVWSNPVCTPTRATLLTGRYGFRTNVLSVGDVLSPAETSIFDEFNDKAPDYSHAVIGKWHLSSNPTHPNSMGVDYFAGLLGGGVQSYNSWNLTENGQTTNTTEYSTTKFTDLAIEWVATQSEPWFLWLAYNAPHTPFHLPPANLHSQGNLPSDEASIEATPLPYYLAMIEAMDSEIGRLLDSMTNEERDNTLIIFIGDNGTPNQVVQDYNSNRAKGSIYQGGVAVPMVVSGKNVTRMNATEETLINTTDLYATLADIAGISLSETGDSKSFVEVLTNSNSNGREFIYTEKYNSQTGGADYTIRNATHKYLYFNNGNEALYNLSANPLEFPNLLNANQLPLSEANAQAKATLISGLAEIRD
tara:strand:+ start:4765 stop:6105 length:1341 start_codon:yes stop_codon:yes gene_type:complete